MFGWLALIVLIAAVGTSGYYRRRARNESETIPRRSEGGVAMTVRLLFALVLVCSIVAHAVAPESMTWASVDVPDWMRWLGALAALSVIPLVRWVLRSLGRNVSETVLTKRDHELVMEGPYRWVRHPLYAAGVLLLVATAFMNKSWLLLSLAVLATILVGAIVVPAEERRLLDKFGERYREYMNETGRFLPPFRVTRRPHRPH
jgi:protein-S-isoprenylcysteine O-methyltransferase Ste14